MMMFIIIMHFGIPTLFCLWGIRTCEGDQIQIITNFVDGSDLHCVLFTEVASYCDSSNILYIASAKL